MMNGANKSRTRLALPTDQDIKRHEAMVQAVFAWMSRTSASQQKLVTLVSRYWQSRGETDFVCDHTLLSRMLHPDQPYIATPARHKAMQILEAAAIICTQRHDLHVIERAGDQEGLVWSGDQEHAFVAHRARLRQVRDRQEGSLVETLSLMGELFVHVRGMDDSDPCNALGETFRQSAAENLLMTLAVVVDRGSAGGDLAQTLAEKEMIDRGRAERIQAEQVARIDATLACVARPSINLNAYAGAGLFFCGQRQRGMYLLLDAVRRGSDANLRHDPHWETLLELADRLLAQSAGDATRWAAAVAQLASEMLARPEADGGRRLLLAAWPALRLPNLVKQWTASNPDLLALLEAPDTRPRLTFPHRPAGRIPRAAAAMLLALAVNILPGMWNNPASPAPADRADQLALSTPTIGPTIAIRGKESQGPPTPPPGGGGGDGTATS